MRLTRSYTCYFEKKSRRRHSIKQQLYGHVPPILQTTQRRRTRLAGDCKWSNVEFISDIYEFKLDIFETVSWSCGKIVRSTGPLFENSEINVWILLLSYKSTTCFVDIFSGYKNWLVRRYFFFKHIWLNWSDTQLLFII